MDRLENRVYYLLTLSRSELLKEFKFSFVVAGGYMLTTLIFLFLKRTSWLNLIVGLLGLVGLYACFYLLDSRRLDITEFVREGETSPEQEEVQEAVVKTEESLMVESSEADMEFFTFKDMVVDTFTKRDSEKMSELLVNRRELMLKEAVS